MNQTYALPQTPVAGLDERRRASFISRTYNHLLVAIIAFVGLEMALFASGLAETIARALTGVSWLLVLGAFMIISWFASRVAWRTQSLGAQYAALAGFVVAEALIFVPMLYMADARADGTIESAALVTLVGFGLLTLVAFTTRKDFSFLRGVLRWGFLVALVAIVGSLLFKFQLGTWFSLAMVALAGGAVLYDTSKVLKGFPEDRYVGAAMELFASIALMFWYVLRLFLSRD